METQLSWFMRHSVYINIFWQAWLHSPPTNLDHQAVHSIRFLCTSLLSFTLHNQFSRAPCFYPSLRSIICFHCDSNRFFRRTARLQHNHFWEKIRLYRNTMFRIGNWKFERKSKKKGKTIKLKNQQWTVKMLSSIFLLIPYLLAVCFLLNVY